MHTCIEVQLTLVDVVAGREVLREQPDLRAHLTVCPVCRRDLAALREAWHLLPGAVEGNPPATAREAVMRYARDAVATQASPLASLWVATRELLAPVGVGAAAALAILLLFTIRGAAASLSPGGVATVGLALSAALALVAGGLTRATTSRKVRSLLAGALGGFGGYVVLSLVMPLPAAVGLCRHSLLGGGAMSIAEVCLVYLVIGTLYAGVPLAVAAYAGSGKDTGWRGGIAEATVFTILAAPLFVLQAGVASVLITGSVMVGLAAGSLAGGVGGVWARARGLARHRVQGLALRHGG